MKVGSSILIYILNDEGEKIQHHSKIIDQDEKYLYIDYPVHTATMKTVFVPTNQPITVLFTSHHALLRFHTMVVKRTKEPMLALVIPKPHKNALEKVQRREYVRVYTAIDIAVYSKKQDVAPVITVTNDLSGGGASIIVPNTVTFEEEELVTLYFVLHTRISGYDYVKTDARVVRYAMCDRIPSMSVEFLMENEQERQKIIHYCFDVERERRRKELHKR